MVSPASCPGAQVDAAGAASRVLVTATASSHVEMVPAAPRLAALDAMLGERPYGAEDEDAMEIDTAGDGAAAGSGRSGADDGRGRIHTFDELLANVQVCRLGFVSCMSRAQAKQLLWLPSKATERRGLAAQLWSSVNRASPSRPLLHIEQHPCRRARPSCGRRWMSDTRWRWAARGGRWTSRTWAACWRWPSSPWCSTAGAATRSPAPAWRTRCSQTATNPGESSKPHVPASAASPWPF